MRHFSIHFISLTVAAFVSIISASSCINKPEESIKIEENISEQDTEAYSKLFASLEAYNKKFGVLADTKSTGDDWTPFQQVAFIDLSGFITGLLFGGQGGTGMGLFFGFLGAVVFSISAPVSYNQTNSIHMPGREFHQVQELHNMSLGELHNYLVQDCYYEQDM